jgi:ABC-2 type transport system ATP-binding protein
MQNLKLKINSLAYSCNKIDILKNVHLKLLGNQIVALLGPNGAGKSTLLKAMASQLYCHQGAIVFNECDSNKNRIEYLKQVGYMPEMACYFPELTVLEQLKLFANTKQVTDIHSCINEVIDMCGLSPVKNKRTNRLSLGYRQRLNLAQALMNRPKLLLLDEPLNGLDPMLIIEFRNIIKQASKYSIIILSTHLLSEAEIISDSVVFMVSGCLSKPVSANVRTHKWLAKFNHKISSQLEDKLHGFVEFEIKDQHILFEGSEEIAKQFVSKTNSEDAMFYLAPVTSNLEELYIQHTQGNPQ